MQIKNQNPTPSLPPPPKDVMSYIHSFLSDRDQAALRSSHREHTQFLITNIDFRECKKKRSSPLAPEIRRAQIYNYPPRAHS